ncbi:LysR family transcriptional regulator [Comamonas endophytica]|uniref:LysR family transcriptional regulator n=1 Tax=Comamonas endophytica TaxID=2949090 RepID=A0ABY6GFB0_9BURK|nr:MULTISPECIES: LysR family transcriptional regulator [unclassified Acidovorax]MCD2512483.1 LysR family transcriptional regulator [Acidovorax sp. D4N7]UYG53149.1 LysR family transcriptional regulator [Acidovorax sp. 5MLIR]
MTPRSFQHLDLNLLRVFDEVMAERSLTRAAHKLALTQPAVSNAMRRLREALDDELLVRQGQGVQPTPRALALWPAVRGALNQLQQTLAPDPFDPATANTTFVLAMADATASTLVPALYAIMEREAPGITLRVLPLTTRDPRQLLEDGEADIAVGYFPAVLADLTAREQSGDAVGFESRRLYASAYICVMREGHPLAEVPLTLDNYCAARHMLVSFSGRSFGFIDEALASLGRKRQVVLTVNQFFTAGRVVVQSDLLTILPRHFVPVTGMAHSLALRELPFSVPPVHVDALWRHRGPQANAGGWLLQALFRAAQATFPRAP